MLLLKKTIIYLLILSNLALCFSCSTGVEVMSLNSRDINSKTLSELCDKNSPPAKVFTKDSTIAIFKDGFYFNNDSIFGKCELVDQIGILPNKQDINIPIKNIYSIT